jgi:molybdate transport repressor ModE-like protein
VTVDPGRLAVLVAIAHAGSISAAARRMSFTPSALSQQLSKLERELGCRLLERGSGGVRLTVAGRLLLGYGERVRGELSAAGEAVRALLDAEPQRLSIGAFPTAGKILVPPVLAEFRRRHPATLLSLLDVEPPDGYGLVAAHELDLLLTHRYPGVAKPDPRGLRREPLLSDPLLLAVPAGHPLADRGPIAVADTAGQEWISSRDGVADRITLSRLAHRARVPAPVAFETHDYEVTLALLNAGLGIAVLPASVLLHADRSGIRVRSFADARPARRVYAVLRPRPSAQVTEVITILRAVATDLAGRIPRVLDGPDESPRP